MKKFCLFLFGIVTFNGNANVLISEYVEGSSYNKAIEISNLGTSDVALEAEGYTLSLYSNGASEPSSTMSLKGILVPNSSLVIYNGGLTTAAEFPEPLGMNNNNVIKHNGDDAYVLRKGEDVIDSFGQQGVDPGSYWGTESENTKDHSLRRAVDVLAGDTNIDDAFDPTTGEWSILEKDTFDGLGCVGVTACTGTEPQPQQEGDVTPVDTCIFTSCDEVPLVKLRTDFLDEIYYVNTHAATDSGVEAFRAALHADIKAGHTQLTYNQVWTALITTDEDPTNAENVVLLYTGKSIPKSQNASVSGNAPDSWNREHVWSKSHGFPESSQLGYTDIHHLRPADASINSLRSNYDFDNGGEPALDGTTVTNNNIISGVSWEPRDLVKGDVARMMFYMAVRYEEGGDVDMPNLKLVDHIDTDGAEFGKLCSLYQWHIDDSVSTDEINRNHVIYEFQGNRNPFIDHPEWVELIYAEQCVEAPVVLPTVSVESITVKETEAVTLTAATNVNELSYVWTQTSGESVTLTGADSATLTFTAPDVTADSTFEFSVKVVDTQGNEATAVASVSVTNTVEVAPVAEKSSSGGSFNFLLLCLMGLLPLFRKFTR